jgi:hypothetical protein
MEAVVRSVNGTDSFGRLAVDWAAAMGLIALYLVASVWLFARAEDRVRRSGDLGRI